MKKIIQSGTLNTLFWLNNNKVHIEYQIYETKQYVLKK